ncbi:MAG: site-specific integrase [Bacilli bacterium]|nr:site-specific integrase [Bacilli bacterium]
MEINEIIKLNKQQTNETLKIIGEEEPRYGLALTILYIYGRNISEVYNLQDTDINKEDETITFIMNNNKITHKIHPQIKQELYKLVEENQGYIFQEGERPLTTFKDGINYYLHKKTGRLAELEFLADLRLTTKEFKRLRGQHLYQEGVPIKTIHELYNNTNMEGTKKTIKYHELKPLIYNEDVEDIISKTNVEIYEEHEFNNNPIFYVINNDKKEAIIEVITDEEMEVIGDEELVNHLTSEEFNTKDLINKLLPVSRVGDYIIYDNMRFLKN